MIAEFLERCRAARKKEQERIARQRFNTGYDWAAGALLRGDFTIEQIEAFCMPGYHYTEFDAGARAAIHRLQGVLS